MRRRIIAVLLSLSVGVAAMPMPVMAEGGSEVVLVEAGAEAAPEAEAPDVEAEEAAPEAEAPVEEAAPAEEEESVEAADELLIIDEEAEAPAVVETEALSVETEEELVVEETEEVAETEEDLAAGAGDVSAAYVHVTVGGRPAETVSNIADYPKLHNGDLWPSGATVKYNPQLSKANLPKIELMLDTSTPLEEGKDYVVTGDSANSAGMHKIQITFISDTYKGLPDIAMTYNIARLDLGYDLVGGSPVYHDSDITDVLVTYNANALALTYTGQVNVPDMTVNIVYKGQKMTLKSSDYEAVAYEPSGLQNNNMIDVGFHKMQLRAKGNYTGDIGRFQAQGSTLVDSYVKYVIKQKTAEPGDIYYMDGNIFYLDERAWNATTIDAAIRSVIADTQKSVWEQLYYLPGPMDREYELQYYVVNEEGERPIGMDDIKYPGTYKYTITTTGLRAYAGPITEDVYREDNMLWSTEFEGAGYWEHYDYWSTVLENDGGLFWPKFPPITSGAFITPNNDGRYFRPLSNYKAGTVLTGTFTVAPHRSMRQVFSETGISDWTYEYEGLDYFERVRERIIQAFGSVGNRDVFDYGANVNVSVKGGVMKDVGTYEVTISGAPEGPWVNEEPIKIKVTITPRELSMFGDWPFPNWFGTATDVRNSVDLKVYQAVHSDGTAEEPRLVLFDKGVGTHGLTLVEGKDYTCRFVRNEKGVAVKVFITGLGNYKTEARNPNIPELVLRQEIERWLTEDDISLKVPLDADFIEAHVDENKNLNYLGYGKPIDIDETEIVVMEHYSNKDERIDPKNYIVVGFDGGEDGKGMTKEPSYTAGDHIVWIQAKEGTIYTGTRAVHYTVTGVPFVSKFEFGKKLPTQPVLVEVEAPMPEIVNIASEGVVLPKEAYICQYSYKDANGNVVTLPGTYKLGDKVRFPQATTYTVIVTANNSYYGMAQYSGSMETTFEVGRRSISGSDITITYTNPTVTWDNANVSSGTVGVTVTDNGNVRKHTLTQGVDYTIEFTGDKIGANKLTIKGTGNYEGTKAGADVTIRPRSVIDATVVLKSYEQPYSGGDAIKLSSDDVIVSYVNGTRKVIPAGEYTVVCDTTKTKVGDMVQVKIVLKSTTDGGHFVDDPRTALVYFRIVQADISDTSVFEVEGVGSKKYTGSPITQDGLVVKDKRTGKAVDPSNYDVKYDNNTAVGTAKVTVTAKGDNYKGSQTKEFEIVLDKTDLKRVEIAPEEAEMVYTGSVLKPEKITVYDENDAVVPENEYKVAFQEDAVNVGTYKVYVSAAASENYEGEVTAEFKITKAENSLSATVSPTSIKIGEKAKVAVTGFGDMKYTSGNTGIVTVAADGTVTGVASGKTTITVATEGDKNHNGATTTVNVTVKTVGKVTASGVSKVFKTKKQSFTLSASALGNVPVTFQSDSNNITVNATTGKVTVKAGYVGTAKITITAAETADYTKASKTVTVKIVPKATTLKSVTSKNGKITAKWAMKNIATCYQLQYATDKNFTKGKGKVWSKSETANSKTIKKTFTKGKTYYVRIRTCTRTDKSELLYSAWSAAKKVTIK